ncbi:MAG: hypothetical protein ACLQAT_07815 [Candidatus Binataceae bacterium]
MNDEKAQALRELRLIRRMMEKSFREVTDDSWPVILTWAIGNSIAALWSQWLMDRGLFGGIHNPWLATVPVCLAVTYWFRRGNWPLTSTHGLTLAGGVLAASALAVLFTVALLMLATWMSLMPPTVVAGLTLMLVGTMFFVMTSITGASFLVGALAWWAGGIAAMKWPSEIFLIMSALFLVGYLLPGYLLKLQVDSRGAADVAAV